jgi:hypothetical protein
MKRGRSRRRSVGDRLSIAGLDVPAWGCERVTDVVLLADALDELADHLIGHFVDQARQLPGLTRPDS